MSSEQRLARWEGALRRVSGAPGEESCPAPAELAALARGELSREERSFLLSHLASCSPCSLETRLALEVSEHATDRPVRRWSGAPPQRLVAAFALVALAALGGLHFIEWGASRVDSRPELRGLARSVAAGETPPDGALLVHAFPTLRWPPGPPGAHHRLELFDATGTILASVETAERQWTPSAPLPPGTYYWQVHTRAGADRSLSPFYTFRLAATSRAP